MYRLERESQCYFDMKYLKEMALSENWDEAENYVSGFTKIDENGKKNAKALEILNGDLKAFKAANENLFNEMALLLTYDDISSLLFQPIFDQIREALEKDSCASVKRILWSPDVTFFWVAYSKHIVQLCSYSGSSDFCLKVEVWDVDSGRNQFTFSGHKAPVSSICPTSTSEVRATFNVAYTGCV
ncbi:hypothetical protein FEM48_Zijuj06G0137700 [Ziziphus jujuba var. spinosa]|uniref:TPR1-like CTLH-containing domain-containing protein n=1 Tax=Ziziphus jujuba var. spinosa TaxID=714518 RepID=A0A978V9M6_ZIZJJ|nr:hypothetical protein FEM48_Zijuj06G0137700 [Ziziphus jujuba var. spinosa]